MTWSAPSRINRVSIEQAAKEFQNKLAFYDLDVDRNPSTPTRYGIRSVPAPLIFKNGELNQMFQGVIEKSKLSGMLGKI